MNSVAARADFFDASALVKVYTDEPGSDVVREYFCSRPMKYTTPFCFYETLNVLKSKLKFKSQLTADQYINAASQLTVWYGASSSRIKDLDFAHPSTFKEAATLAKQYDLDLSDAFQILSVKKGYFAPLVRDSATILVTADKALAEVARHQGLRAWDLMSEPAPR